MVERVLVGPGILRVSKPGIAVTASTPDSDLIFNPITNFYNGCAQAGQVLWSNMTVTNPVAGQTLYRTVINLTDTYTAPPRCMVGVWSDFYEGGQFMEFFASGANHTATGASWRCSVATGWDISTTQLTLSTIVNNLNNPPYPIPEHRWNYSYLVFVV